MGVTAQAGRDRSEKKNVPKRLNYCMCRGPHHTKALEQQPLQPAGGGAQGQRVAAPLQGLPVAPLGSVVAFSVGAAVACPVGEKGGGRGKVTLV